MVNVWQTFLTFSLNISYFFTWTIYTAKLPQRMKFTVWLHQDDFFSTPVSVGPKKKKSLFSLNHTFPNGLFLFTAGLFYKKWDGSKISPILLFCFCDNIFVPVIFSDHYFGKLCYQSWGYMDDFFTEPLSLKVIMYFRGHFIESFHLTSIS